MFMTEEGVGSRTYVHVPGGAAIHVRRREDDDIVSVRFDDERLVLEFEDDVVPRVVEALTAGR